MRASFSVAWEIARTKAPHTSGERLVKSAAVEMARIKCGEAVANKLAMVPLSDNTIKRRIEELSVDILQQTIAAVKQSEKFSLQLDETTDIGNDAQLMVFVQYRAADDYVEQFLLCRQLSKNTTGEKYLKRWIRFFKSISFRGLTVCLLVLWSSIHNGNQKRLYEFCEKGKQ